MPPHTAQRSMSISCDPPGPQAVCIWALHLGLNWETLLVNAPPLQALGTHQLVSPRVMLEQSGGCVGDGCRAFAALFTFI